MGMVLSGKELAAKELKRCQDELARLRAQNVRLKLATIRVGKSKDAEIYFTHLKRSLDRLGIGLEAHTFGENAPEKSLTQRIAELNRRADVTGILVFSPLPKRFSMTRLFDHIHISKDVEGRTFLKSHYGVLSPTANSVLALIEATGVNLTGKQAVVVGHSDLVGKPCAVLLADRMATVTLCHKETKNLRSHIAMADVVVVAVGRPKLFPGTWLKRGAIVIDVGENFINGKVVGDVDFESAKKRAAFITPVPGGVGPVTNVMLIRNLLKLYGWQKERNGNR